MILTKNGSSISEFVLLGFSVSRPAQLFLSSLALTCYIATLLSNFLIILTIWFEPRLFNSPMYFFLANLSLLDIGIVSVAGPKLVADLLTCGHTISYGSCMAQLLFLHLLGGAEMFLLTVMAYDRYVAICRPLRYSTIMDRQLCLRFIVVCWTAGLIHTTNQMVAVSLLPFCGPNVLDNFYCDLPQVIKLACTDTRPFEMLIAINSGLIIIPCLLTLLVSYLLILTNLCGRFGKGGGGKALSTCSSHLMVVCLFYLPPVFVYINPSSSSQIDKMAPVFYTVVTPGLNPLIYTLRNKEMKAAMGKLKSRCKLFLNLSVGEAH